MAAAREGIRDIVLSGGCFMNRLLAADVESRLLSAGLAVYEACELPPNDGGIAAGQAWVSLLAPDARQIFRIPGNAGFAPSR